MATHYRIETVTRNRFGYATSHDTKVTTKSPSQYVREWNDSISGGPSNRSRERVILLSSQVMTDEEVRMYETNERNRILDQVCKHAETLKW